MFNINTSTVFLLILLYIHISMTLFSIYSHRSLSHKAVVYHPYFEKLIRFILWLTVGVQNNFKTANHMIHHRYADNANDPHSIHISGWQQVGLKRYINVILHTVFFMPVKKDKPADFVKHIHYRNDYTTLYPRIGKLLFLLINTALFGVNGIILYVMFNLIVHLVALILIDIGGHLVGYRNFDTADKSTNLPSLLAPITGGEHLHNNHHANIASAKWSVKWHEVDTGYIYIKLFEFLGLAKITSSGKKVKYA